MAEYDAFAKKYVLVEDCPEIRYCVKPSFIKMLGKVSGKSAIDLACGSGFSTRLVKEAGAVRVIGVDISEKEVEIARLRGKKGVSYFVADATKPLGGWAASFDIASGVFLLHYAKSKKELYQICKNLFQVLKKGGRFVGINSHPANPENPLAFYRENGFLDTINHPLKEGSVRRGTYYFKGKKLW